MAIAHTIIHSTIYYIVWFFSILTAANNYYWLGFIISLITLALQYTIEKVNGSTNGLLPFVALLTLAGFCIDSLFVQTKLVIFHANPFLWRLSPPWMIGVWINFSATLYILFRQRFSQYWLLTTLAFLGFPLAYLAGEKLGAATLTYGRYSAILIGLIWGIILAPTLSGYQRLISRRHDA